MTQKHPITPPPELVEQWRNDEWHHAHGEFGVYIATQAARWGADQELEACIQYFHEYDPSWGEDSELIAGLRSTRRPKPPSLKEQALAIVCRGNQALTTEEQVTIRRALEQLDD